MLRYSQQVLVGICLDLGCRDLASVSHRGQTHLDANGLLGQIHARVLDYNANRPSSIAVVVRWFATSRSGQAGERKESYLSRHRRLPPELNCIEIGKDRP